jgi:hypothetical protein
MERVQMACGCPAQLRVGKLCQDWTVIFKFDLTLHSSHLEIIIFTPHRSMTNPVLQWLSPGCDK